MQDLRGHPSRIDGLRPAALPAWRALTAALVELDSRGIHTPCTEDPAAFLGNDLTRRYAAAKACGLCPVRVQCGSFADANRERAHVWGGRDRTWGSASARRRCEHGGGPEMVEQSR